jgi:hypothetical protein
MRLYSPKEAVLNGSWNPPAVTKARRDAVDHVVDCGPGADVDGDRHRGATGGTDLPGERFDGRGSP